MNLRSSWDFIDNKYTPFNGLWIGADIEHVSEDKSTFKLFLWVKNPIYDTKGNIEYNLFIDEI